MEGYHHRRSKIVNRQSNLSKGIHRALRVLQLDFCSKGWLQPLWCVQIEPPCISPYLELRHTFHTGVVLHHFLLLVGYYVDIFQCRCLPSGQVKCLCQSSKSFWRALQCWMRIDRFLMQSHQLNRSHRKEIGIWLARLMSKSPGLIISSAKIVEAPLVEVPCTM